MRFRPMTQLREAAGKHNLADVLDAFEIYCSGYGTQPEAWKLLGLQLSLYLKSHFYNKPQPASPYILHTGISFDSFLIQQSGYQLGHLTSDMIIALFWVTGILESHEHVSRGGEHVEIIQWKSADDQPFPQVTSNAAVQSLTRRYLGSLDFTTVHLMIDGISNQLRARSVTMEHHFRYLENDWNPCASSNCHILLHLDIGMSRADFQLVLDTCKRTYISTAIYPQSTQQSPRTPKLLERTISRAGSFLRNSRQNQDAAVKLPSIVEDGKTETANHGEDPVAENVHRQSKRGSFLKRNSNRSSYSDYRSFVTALTHGTGASARRSYATGHARSSLVPSGITDKRSTIQTFLSCPADDRIEEKLGSSDWSETLKKKDIVSDPELENWSQGRGQHAQYSADERDMIPLEDEYVLGKGATAVVTSVRCKRVRLVKKVIVCNKKTRLNREDAIQEIQQLYKAQHTHIVRLVGTYVIEDELAILTYPCAEWNLEEFLTLPSASFEGLERSYALQRFFACLIRVLDFIHSFPIKHMDIKPQNMLVRRVSPYANNHSGKFKIYLTDFGSSRFYPSVEDTETDNWTPFTRAYAAKEVVLQETRGLSADIFSLGCVFAEMLAGTLEGRIQPTESDSRETHRDALMTARSGKDGRPRPYHLKLASVCKWLGDLPVPEAEVQLQTICVWTFKMLNNDAACRPTAREIAQDPFIPFSCMSCTMFPGPEKFEAAPAAR